MKTIIVPTDFTAVSKNAVQFAVDMAVHIHATILLVHAYQVPVMVSDIPTTTISVDEIKKNAVRALSEMKAEIDKQIGFKINVITDARSGNIADELIEVCNNIHPFAVIMGSSRSGKLQRMFFGSAALSAMHALAVPVLVVPPHAKFKPVKKIGLAYDFHHVVMGETQEEIRSVVNEFNAELHVLNVVNDGYGKPEDKEHTFLLHRTIGDLHPEYHFIDKVSVEEGLTTLADELGLDLLIVIPRKHKLLESLFRKSHADQLALHTHVPLMAIHA